MTKISWLPDCIFLGDYRGIWTLYVEALYDVYRNDFIVNQANYEGIKIITICKPMENGKEASFWHIIQEGKTPSQKIPELKRCEKIRWPRAIIDNHRDPEVKVWEENKRGKRRLIIYLECDEYVVILERRSTYLLLWTAYPVKYENKKRDLIRNFLEYKKKQAPPPS